MFKKLGMLLLLGLFAITTQAHALIIFETEPNDSIAQAQSLDGNFSLDANSIIYESETIPHVTINATTAVNNRYDYYSFTLGDNATRLILDVDGSDSAVDPYIRLYNSAGSQIASNDNGTPVYDPGSYRSFHSLLDMDVSAYAGQTLYTSVYNEVNAGGNYTYHVSVLDVANDVSNAVPEPTTMALFGLGLVGATVRRKFA